MADATGHDSMRRRAKQVEAGERIIRCGFCTTWSTPVRGGKGWVLLARHVEHAHDVDEDITLLIAAGTTSKGLASVYWQKIRDEEARGG